MRRIAAVLIALLAGGCLLNTGCATAMNGRGEVGVGSRTDYYVYHEARRSTDNAGASLNLQPAIDYLIQLQAEADAEATGDETPE